MRCRVEVLVGACDMVDVAINDNQMEMFETKGGGVFITGKNIFPRAKKKVKGKGDEIGYG